MPSKITLTTEAAPGAMIEPLALRPKEAAAALGIGAQLLWSMTNRGEIPHTRIGRCVVYPVSELRRWLADRAAAESGGR